MKRNGSLTFSSFLYHKLLHATWYDAMTKRSTFLQPAPDPMRYLKLRGLNWFYRRRVPEHCAHFDARSEIVKALKTSSLEVAKLRRDAMERADDLYWQSGILGHQAGSEASYEAAKARVVGLGFEYKSAADIAATSSLEEILRRIDVAFKSPRDEAAILGAYSVPETTVRAAMLAYVNDIGIGETKGKSEQQKRKWRERKLAAAEQFIEVLGDKALLKITRADAVKYQAHWTSKVMGDKNASQRPLSASTANRAMGNIRQLFDKHAQHLQLDLRNPFEGISWSNSKRMRLQIKPFDVEFVQDTFLKEGAFATLNQEARLIFLALIETGCRPSEICNLTGDRIFLNAPHPYIRVEFREDRQLKTESSVRDVPLLGISLAAMRRAPHGFPSYRDKETNFSGLMMKFLRTKGWLPSKHHRVYSMRHTMEDRMKAAGLEDDFRRVILGHRIDRPEYGEGWTIAYKAQRLAPLALLFSEEVLEGTVGRALRTGGRTRK